MNLLQNPELKASSGELPHGLVPCGHRGRGLTPRLLTDGEQVAPDRHREGQLLWQVGPGGFRHGRGSGTGPR